MGSQNQQNDPSVKKPRRKSNTRPTGFTEIQFVSINLTVADKDALSAWNLSPDELLSEVNRWVENGYKVSLSPDFDHDSFVVSLTGKECTPIENKDRCLSSRGSTLQNALLSMMFKLQRYCPDGIFPDPTGKAYGDFN